MTGLVAGKVAVVTGAASGNGRACAMALARHGAAGIVVADIRADPREGGTATHELITMDTGAKAVYVHCDLSGDPRALDDVAHAGELLGGTDILVNNAGVYRAEDFFTVSVAHYDRMMNTNVRGPYFLTQAIARFMAERGRGCVVNLTSGSGIVGSARRSTYGTSKGALQVLTYTLAAELGPLGIRVNAVAPGSIRTAMTTVDVPYLPAEGAGEHANRIALRRIGEPQDVANAVLFLCSELASFVNGTSFEVDGGELRAVSMENR